MEKGIQNLLDYFRLIFLEAIHTSKKSKTGIRWLVSVDIVVNQTLVLIAGVFALEKKVAIATQLLNFNPTKNLDAALSTSLKGVTYTQQTLTCMKSTIETLEKGVKYVQS